MAHGLDDISHALEAFLSQMKDRLEATLTKLMLDFEAQAKADHPYKDDSGFNTASIRGFVSEVTDTVLTGVLTAGMVYSIFLEKSLGGKYAYLGPVIEKNKDHILLIIAAAMRNSG